MTKLGRPEIALAYELIVSGVGRKLIADAFGVATATLDKELWRHGLSARGHREYIKRVAA